MPNYYEVLKLLPTATRTEVEYAIEAEYNQWRRLVTHHDPKMVEQANRHLRVLEEISINIVRPCGAS